MPTPLQWLSRLEAKLDEQRLHARHYDAYYTGKRCMRIIEEDYLDVFGLDENRRPMLEAPYSNVASIGIDALSERLVVEGFRVGSEDNVDGAAAADAVWQGNDLDAMSPVGHTETSVKGTAALLVWPGENGAVVSVEDAEQLVVHRSASPPYDVDGALKLYVDEWTGESIGMLWTTDPQMGPGRYTFRQRPNGYVSLYDGVPTAWDVTGGYATRDELPTTEVPVVELANRQRLLRPPVSELVHVAPLADVHDKLIADLVIAASFGAIPIRTATGVKLLRRVDPVSGETELVSPFDVRADRAMVSEDPDARFGTIPAGDLAGYVAALDMVLREIRALTRVPQHYYGEGVSAGMSGETLKAAEASLVRKVDGMQPRLGASWRRAMRLALEMDGSTFADQPIVTRWRDTETQVEAQAVDAAQKLNAIGVPLEVVLERIGFDRATIARAVKLRNAAALQGQNLVDLLKADTVGAGAPTSVPVAAA